MQNAIKKAIKLAGSQSALARVLGISPEALGQQLRKGRILPHHCVTIEKAFPGEITRNELDPDHFGEGRDCVVILFENLQSTSTTL